MNMTSRWQESVNSISWIIVAGLVASFIAVFLSWQLGFFCLLFMATAWWVWQNPEQGLWLLIVLAPILPMLKITQTIGTATLVKDVIIVTLFTRQFLWPIIRQTLPYRRAALTTPIIWLIIWTGMEALRADNGLVLGILRARDIIIYAFLYFGVLYLPHSQQRMKQRLVWLLNSAGVVALLGIYQWLWAMDSAVLRFDPVRMIWIPRISSTLAHPSIFGQYIVSICLLVAAIGMVWTNKKQRLVWLGLWLIILPFIWLTYSRAVWIGFIVGMSAVIVTWGMTELAKTMSRKSLVKIIVVAGVIMVGGTLGMMHYTRAGIYVRSFIDPRYASNEERLQFMARLIGPMTNTEALVGKGLGDVMMQNFRQDDIQIYDIATGNSHDVQLIKNQTLVDNQYLKTMVEMGLAGLLLYGWLYWRFLLSCFDTIGATNATSKIIGLWGVGWLAAFVMQAFFIDIWDIWPTNAMFWIVAGLTAASRQVILTDSERGDQEE